jgi:hypothetical protein
LPLRAQRGLNLAVAHSWVSRFEDDSPYGKAQDAVVEMHPIDWLRIRPLALTSSGSAALLRLPWHHSTFTV